MVRNGEWSVGSEMQRSQPPSSTIFFCRAGDIARSSVQPMKTRGTLW